MNIKLGLHLCESLVCLLVLPLRLGWFLWGSVQVPLETLLCGVSVGFSTMLGAESTWLKACFLAWNAVIHTFHATLLCSAPILRLTFCTLMLRG